MRWKYNLCTRRRHEHQQGQIEKEMSSFKKNILQYFINGNVLHNRSQNLYYNYIRRLFLLDMRLSSENHKRLS